MKIDPVLALLVLCGLMAMLGTIQSTLPASVRRPGSFHEFVHTTAGRGLTPLDIRLVVVGIKSAAGTAPQNVPVQIFDDADADAKLGVGSQIGLMARMAFKQSRRQGTMPQIWAVPIDAPGASVAAAQTLTVTGPATASGDVVVRVQGRTIRAGVSSGDAQNTIAAALEAALDAMAPDLPVTAGVAANVVTCTNRTTGVQGNDVVYEVVSVPPGVAVVSAQSAAGTGSVDITASIDTLLDKDYDFICVGNHTATDVSDFVAHNAAAWGFNEKKYRWGVIGERGSVATANGLATGGNDKTVIVAAYEGCPNSPGEIAAAVGAAAAGKSKPNASLNDEVLELYPPLPSLAFSASEIESLLASGVTPIAPSFDGSFSRIIRLVTTKTTEGGATFDALRDLAFSRTAAFIARQVDIKYRTLFKQEVIDGDGELLKRVRDMVIEVDRAAEGERILRDVDALLQQILVEEHPTVAGRLLLQNTHKAAGPFHQLAAVHTQIL